MLKSTEARKTAHSMTASADQCRVCMSEDWSVGLLDEIHIVEQRRGNGADARGALRRHGAVQLSELLPDTPVESGVLAGDMRAHAGVIRAQLLSSVGCIRPTPGLGGANRIPAGSRMTTPICWTLIGPPVKGDS